MTIEERIKEVGLMWAIGNERHLAQFVGDIKEALDWDNALVIEAKRGEKSAAIALTKEAMLAGYGWLDPGTYRLIKDTP